MPFEIHAGLLDVSDVHLFKISSRNASLKYINACLDSYLFCEEDLHIKQNIENYMLWSRLAWHTEYFNRFLLDHIRATKEKIHQGIKESICLSDIGFTQSVSVPEWSTCIGRRLENIACQNSREEGRREPNWRIKLCQSIKPHSYKSYGVSS